MYVYVDSEDTLPSNLICAVCHDVAGTHSACPGCQQTFCEVCVHKWFDVQRTTGSNCTCPYCRRRLRFSDLTHDPAVQQQLDQLSVLCPNAPAGCPGVMPRADLPAHLQHSCMLEQVSCRFCGTTGVRSAILRHEGSSCRQRLVPCSNAAAGCEALVPLDSMQQHLELNCSFTCKACPHCATPVPRLSWLDHLQHSCPAQQPCPLRMYGCSFSGAVHAVAAHSGTCSYATRQRQQQLQDAHADARITAAAAGPSDCGGELPGDCVPDAAAAFGASTAASSDRQVRQLLLDSLPQAALPPRLKQQPQQQPQAPSDDAAASHKQLATIAPPKIFAAPAAAAGGTPRQGATQADAHTSGNCSMRSAVELLALGAPGCLSGFGLQSDPLLECAWRVMLNSAVIQVFQVQETAADQQLSTFILYSSICRAWDTVLAWTDLVGSSSPPPDAQQQESQQQQQQQQTDSAAEASPEEEQQTGAAASNSSSSGGAGAGSGPAQAGVLAAFGALFSGGTNSNTAAAQGQTTQQQEQEQQQQQERPQLTGRQIWERMLASGRHTQRQQGQQQQGGRRSADSQASSSSSGEAGSFADRDDVDDGLPGLQRGLYDEEYTDLEFLFSKTAPGRQLMWAAASAVYGLCLWLQVGGPCYCAKAADAQWLGELRQLASRRVGRLTVKMLVKMLKQQLRAARHSRAGAGSMRELSALLLKTVASLEIHEVLHMERELARVTQGLESHLEEAPAGGLNPAAPLQMRGPGSTFAELRQQLEALAGADVASVPGGSHKHVPPWLRGLRPLVALELGSALLLLHDVRADQCEVSLIPGVNSHVQHGYRAYWAPSVLAGAGAWLGPGFKLNWQALAVVNDMMVAVVEELCQVLGDSFYDHAEERVPLSPGLALEAARLVLPAGLLASGLPHLLRLSSSYRDVSCEDLSEVTWEKLARKLGLVAELDKLVGLVHELLPVTFEDEDEEDSEDEYGDEDEDTTSSEPSLSDATSSSSSGSDATGGDESSSEYEEASADSYVTDEGEQTGTEDDGSSSDGSGSSGSSGGSSDGGSGGAGLLGVYDRWLRLSGRQRRPSLERATADREAVPAAASPPAAAAGGGVAGAAAGGQARGRSDSRGGIDAGSGAAPQSSGNSSSKRAGRSSGSAGSGSSSGSEWETESDEDNPAWQQLQAPVGRSNTNRRLSPAAAGGSSSAAASVAPAAAGRSRSRSSRRDPQAAASKLQADQQQQQQQTVPPPRQQHSQSGQAPQQEASGAGTSAAAATEADADADAGKAETAETAAAAAMGSGDGSCVERGCQWLRQWADNLDSLAKAAAAAEATQGGASSSVSAAAGASAPAGSCNMPGAPAAPQQQQQQQPAGEQGGSKGPAGASGLSPYAAQLLAQACEAARRRPEQLLLQQGSLAPQGLSEPRADEGEAAGCTTAAAHSGAGSSAGASVLPAAELVAQPTATHHSQDAGAAAGAAAGAPETAAAAGTAGGAAGAGGSSGPSATEAAAVAATGGSGGARGWEHMQTARQQQQQQPKVEEPGDACTHGVVLLVGLLEVVLKRLLQGAGRLAAADPDLLLSSSTASKNSSSSSGDAAENAATGAAAGGADGDGRVLLLQSVQPRVVVTAKHVQLAVAQDEDLTTLLLRSWPGAAVKSAVCWAGAAPCLDPQLLPDAASEPLTAFLLDLAHGPPLPQQQQQQADAQQGAGSNSSGGSSGHYPLLFPADLRVYCGVTVSAPPAATPCDAPSAGWFAPAQSTAAAGQAEAAAAGGQGEAAVTAECEGPSATCCFLSGWQCSNCAAQTAELAAAGLEARLAACQAGLQHVASQQQEEEEGVPLLSEEQLQQLATATRLYHLQQPCWYDSRSNSSNNSSSSSAEDNSVPGCTAEPTAVADRAQLQEVAALLRPLQDIVALREAHLQQQQQQPGCALPPELFDQTVQDVLGDVLAARRQQRQQEERVQEQLRRVLGPGAGSSAVGNVPRSPGTPAASLGSPARAPNRLRTGSGGEGAHSPAAAGRSQGDSGAAVGGGAAAAEAECELGLQADALQLLQQAAEDFLVQQLSGANRLALHAGRQEVGLHDLRLALLSSGYGHLLPGGPGAGADSRGAARAAAAPGRAGGRGKGGGRVLGAGLFMH